MLYHQALAQALRDIGTDVVFGVLGDANLFAIDSYRRNLGGRYVSFGHEGGAVLAAAGYSSVTGRLGVATVTHGPALTNTVTALVDATRSNTPLLLMLGDTNPADRDHLQDIDQRSIVAPTGAGWEQARTPESVVQDVRRAAQRALSERRPVVLNVPITFQWSEVDVVRDERSLHVAHPLAAVDDSALEDALGIIASSRRPIVLGGFGAAAARSELEALAATIGAPVAASLRGHGLFRGHPHDLGTYGGLAHEVAAEAISRADCVISFGASLNAKTTDRGALIEGKRVVQVDDRPTALAGSRADSVVVGDAAQVARALTAALVEAEIPPTSFASSELAEALEARRARRPSPPPAEGIDLVHALQAVESAFPDDRTLVIDDGRFILTAYRELSAPDPRAYVHTCSFASIGLAVASAVGAQVGRPERPALVVCGDGGFMSAGVQEFSTAVRHGLDMVVVVVNDQAYGAEHMQFRARSMDPEISTFDWPSFAAIGEAMGGIGVKVTNHAELDAAVVSLTGRDRPLLLELCVDPETVPAPGY